jgi:septum formation protein
MLQDVGLDFTTMPADIDERSIEESMKHAASSEIAVALACEKALAVSRLNPGSYVIGSDQMLDFKGERLHKSENVDQARKKLLQLSGGTHHLISAVALVHNGEIIWSAQDQAALTMRAFNQSVADQYCDAAGDALISCVGGYALEAHGAWLFEKIEGDYFTILGLPLLPLLGALQDRFGGDHD